MKLLPTTKVTHKWISTSMPYRDKYYSYNRYKKSFVHYPSYTGYVFE